MNYHNIIHDDMRNGTGLRVTLFLSGCNHYCNNCQNPQTWDPNGGIKFDLDAIKEIFDQLQKDYISGITFSGGDPLYEKNYNEVLKLCEKIKIMFPSKDIWIYTGYSWEYILGSDKLREILKFTDVIVDGLFIEELSDIKYHWAGSTNQRVIDVKKSIESENVVLLEG